MRIPSVKIKTKFNWHFKGAGTLLAISHQTSKMKRTYKVFSDKGGKTGHLIEQPTIAAEPDELRFHLCAIRNEFARRDLDQAPRRVLDLCALAIRVWHVLLLGGIVLVELGVG